MGNKDAVFFIMHFSKCITECKSPRTDFSSYDWLEKRNAF